MLLFAGMRCLAASNLSPDSLREAGDYSKAHGGLSLLVIQDGAVLLEEYGNGSSRGSRRKIYSGTKGFWALTAMAAVKDGIVRLDDPVAGTITEWRSDSRKALITIRELLDFTSGLDPAFCLHGSDIDDRSEIAVRTPLVSEPGRVFTYGPSHLQVFCEVLRRKLEARGETPVGYINRRVLCPMGIGSVDFKKDRCGNPLLATGFRLTAREWARMGELILGGGHYGGREIVPRSLLEECFRGSRVNPAFGIGFWLNKEASRGREPDIEDQLELKWYQQNWTNVCVCREAPPDMVVSLGSCYQRLYVIPSLRLVIVRQGNGARFSDARFLRALLRH